jgi:hypothetical protein
MSDAVKIAKAKIVFMVMRTDALAKSRGMQSQL